MITTGEAAELLRNMVAIPSESFNEEAVSLFVSDFMTSRGLKHHRIGNNIVAYAHEYDPSKKTLMMCAHMDTVAASPDYILDPFKPDYAALDGYISAHSNDESKPFSGVSSASEMIYGLGSNDDGGSVVSQIAVLSYFAERQDVLPFNLMLVLSVQEERSGAGGMKGLWGNGVNADWAIVGEPTGMQAAISERGLLVLDGEAEGVSGHAARNTGVNALYIALDDIARLRSYDFDRLSPVMGKVGLNVTMINAGKAHNVIPDRCTFVVDIRPTEMYSNQEILDNLQAICTSRLTPRNMGNHSSSSFEDSPLVSVLSEMGVPTFSSLTTSDWMRIGCDAVKIGPGDSTRSHKKDEYVTVKEIDNAIDIYKDFILRFAEHYGNTME